MFWRRKKSKGPVFQYVVKANVRENDGSLAALESVPISMTASAAALLLNTAVTSGLVIPIKRGDETILLGLPPQRVIAVEARLRATETDDAFPACWQHHDALEWRIWSQDGLRTAETQKQEGRRWPTSGNHVFALVLDVLTNNTTFAPANGDIAVMPAREIIQIEVSEPASPMPEP